MRRVYADTSKFRSPMTYDSLSLQGLGQSPAGRGYFDVSQFLQPYANGYFQDNTLMGLGAEQTTVAAVTTQVQGLPTWALCVGCFVGGVLIGRMF